MSPGLLWVPRLSALGLPAALALLSLGPAAPCQGPPPYREIWTRIGPDAQSFFTRGLSPIGDITGDGVRDVAASLSLGPGGEPGEIWFLSGKDGRILRRIGTPYRVEALAPAGDLNGDGTPDLLSYDIAQRAVVARSGADGRVLFARAQTIMGPPVHFGWATGTISDLDNDGWREVVVASPFAPYGGDNQRGDLRIFSGRTAQELRFLPPVVNEMQLGRSMALPGDLNGDGVEDIVAGSPGACRLDLSWGNCPFQDGAAGQVTAFCGATGRRLWSVRGLAGGDRLGMSLAAVGDLDGDGVPDLVAGAYPSDFSAHPKYGYVMALSGRTGAVLGLARGSQPDAYLGLAVAGVGDVDGDGHPDFAATWTEQVHDPIYGRFWVGRISVFSGRDFSRIQVIHDNQPGTGFGNNISGLGPVEGSDFPALLVGRGGWGREWSRGAVHALSLAPPGVEAFGEPCGAAQDPPPRIGVTGSPRAGAALPVHVASPLPAFTSFLLLGTSDRLWGSIPLPLDLAGMGFPGCSLLVAPQVVSAAPRGPRGSATHTLAIPNDPSLWGATFFVQGLTVDTSGPQPHTAFTRALRCAIAAPP